MSPAETPSQDSQISSLWQIAARGEEIRDDRGRPPINTRTHTPTILRVTGRDRIQTRRARLLASATAGTVPHAHRGEASRMIVTAHHRSLCGCCRRGPSTPPSPVRLSRVTSSERQGRSDTTPAAHHAACRNTAHRGGTHDQRVQASRMFQTRKQRPPLGRLIVRPRQGAAVARCRHTSRNVDRPVRRRACARHGCVGYSAHHPLTA